MLRSAIVSLPITPRKNPTLGLILIPFLMDVLSKKMGVDRVLALNVNGSKLYGEDIEIHAQGYVQANSNFGIIPHSIWRDDQQENMYWINVFFQQLFADGIITMEDRELLRCPCRAVETLALAENRSETRRLYEKKEGLSHCKICGGIVTNEIDSVYLFRVPSIPVNWHVFPEFTKKEILHTMKRFTGTQLLISRTRPSALPLWTGQEHIFLDVDFAWQLCLPILRRFGYQPVVLVGSQKNLFGCYLTMLLLYLIDKTTVELVVPAYCKTAKEEGGSKLMDFPNWNKSHARLFLAAHCTFHKKEVSFDPSLLKSIARMPPTSAMQAVQSRGQQLSEALLECEGVTIRDLLSSHNYTHNFLTELT